ncbi:autoinducer binding domain-containing protein [Burkholderia alba]|uniref:autoinducer binding domain-containing protein n=1 Tax=Burkholderia alba TaxID=2683677 RepID=UPI002B061EA1|nr:autoinducer binding domain-containing protein [Burkholderia alba]
MTNWAEDVLSGLDGAKSEDDAFGRVEAAAADLGFEYCAYGLRVPWPLSRPKIVMRSNYPEPWQRRYLEAGFLDVDPIVAHGRRSQTPVIWSDELFAPAHQLWVEAQAFGLRFGWAQASCDAYGVMGMLVLVRSSAPLTATELAAKEFKMRWLVNTAHFALGRRMLPKLMADPERGLTEREVEVLKWAADGKTSGEISKILAISVDTVNFHVKNAIVKLKTANKTAAVVRAAMLGLLS